MLIYIRCPTCSRVISKNLDSYLEDLENIRNNPKYNKKDKERLGSELLVKYGFTEICCRIRIMGLIPYHKIIQS
ncbi:DNA-directed RNA polymerase subunit N [Acanthamoeba polyphaga moumouvirus]|uniref:DNA-directed RNA polymerase subunit N n=1 Tax=Acanthamoeba polyphaga moumouvirus TaxID=1269028 RepID=L7RD52_9VIRU|nr:DNA-directed RNA polymerase subunit N [Acanthamoeba polyphaga moumouvirus]AGC02003.1 DNA-directed RNA polymerase subunit N [Acanthamoeba polyphaga moumouvirus]AQN68371.1 DNA-directed RNA polymerase subunit N [Saudi moumouvirus]